MENFNKKLIEWYLKNKRFLPWKNKIDAYQIWLSEIILQQTRIEQGTPYYLKFIKRYPSIIDFANAEIDEILKLWEGLGYYSRARNMHITAKNIRDNYEGEFPNTYDELKKLKGVGDYTAAAIASFAYNLPCAVVDGNVYRVLARYFGQDIPIDTTQGKKYFQQKAQELINKREPATHNQAMMDFGSLICTPKNAKCNSCTFSSECVAFNQNLVDTLPVKSKRIIKKDRFLHFFIFSDKKQIVIKQRDANDIWKLLFDFPCIETTSSSINKKIIDTITDEQKLPEPFVFKQILTHQKITAYFYEMNTINIKQKEDYMTINISDLGNYAFPKIISNYLENRLLYLS